MLHPDDAHKKDSTYNWDFILNHTGRYVVQVISKERIPEPAPSASVTIGEYATTEKLRTSFIIQPGNPLNVLTFNKVVTFNNSGRQTVSLQLEIPFEQVRIVPNYNNRMGSEVGMISPMTYREEWERMHNSPQKQASLKWLGNAKFGMFIHWGLYSRMGGIWKGVKIDDSPHPGPRVAEWLMRTMQIPREEYEKLTETFNPDTSWAKCVARLAKETGMKYVVITSKHHDGFALFNSACSDYNIVDRTPYKSDAIKELYDACLAEGLEFGVYYSHGIDWHDGTDGGYSKIKKRNDSLGIPSDPRGANTYDPSPDTYGEYLENKAYPQVAELLKLLPEMKLLWFDGYLFLTEEQAFRFYKLAYDMNPGVIVNDRVGYSYGDYIDFGDNQVPKTTEKADEVDKLWETCGTTNNSWGYKSYDNDFKSTRELLYWMINIVSKGGIYLLNIGPDGQGHVPEVCAANMRGVGQWMKTNGEAIYGTTNWKIFHEGPTTEVEMKGTDDRARKGFEARFTPHDFWFTQKDDAVYAISLVEPRGEGVIRSLNTSAATVSEVYVPGQGKVEFEQNKEGLTLRLPKEFLPENGFVVKAIIVKELYVYKKPY